MVQQVPCLESRFEIQDVIGRGSFGSIYKALDKTTNEIVAIKALTKPPLSDFTKWQVMRRELTLTQRLRHKNIARFYDVIEDGQDVYIVMEYLSGGSLLDYVNKTRGVSEPAACEIFCQLIDGLDYLHNVANVVHRDIKAENIMFDRGMVPKFIDFGFARQLNQGQEYFTTVCGSLFYLPPEMIYQTKCNKAADIWSLGVVLFGIVSGRLPFFAESTIEIVEAIRTKEPVYSKQISPELRDLLTAMLTKDPMKRITISQIKQHPWVASIRNQYSSDWERSMAVLPILNGGPGIKTMIETNRVRRNKPILQIALASLRPTAALRWRPATTRKSPDMQ